MAGPNDDDHKAAPGKQTGTRPKSRTNTSLGSVTGAGSQSAWLTLMREYQAVTDSLALARDQIEREGQRIAVTRRQEASSEQARPEDIRLREIESLRSRLLELETVSTTEQEAQPSVDNFMDSDTFFTRLR